MDVVLNRGREASVYGRHPWLFSGAVAKVTGEPSPGATVNVVDSRGQWLAHGAWSPDSQIRVRIWSFDPDETIDPAFFERRLADALQVRVALGLTGAGRAFRLCNAESDGLPGLVVDIYDRWAVAQFLSAGAERWKAEIAAAIVNVTGCRGIHERSDVEVRRKEGLQPVSGGLTGEEPPAWIEINDNGPRMLVDVRLGHKTGSYLDQASNRLLCGQVASGDVLNVFCYTGGFGLHAAARAEHVVQLDQSGPALEMAARNAALNGCSERCENLQGDAFSRLRELHEAGRRFDLVVLDPPKFAASASQVERAAGAYKAVNRLGAQLVRPGGWLMTFSCSGHIRPELFGHIVSEACADAEVDGRVVQRLQQAPDHPTGLHYPEGHYLKGLLLRL